MVIKTLPQNLLKVRNSLLQKTLRPNFSSFPIESEYPLVLGKELKFSHCLFLEKFLEKDPNTILAHANLWERSAKSMDEKINIPIGILGNVATNPKAQKKGYMKNLLNHLIENAKIKNLHALILWSDLLEFYNKFGFKPFGEELRYTFNLVSLNEIQPTEPSKFLQAEDLDDKIIEWFLSIKPRKNFQIQRTINEFRALLTIPNTILMGIPGKSFLILNKGFDMQGVIHEWGASDPFYILSTIKEILLRTGIEELTLLAPSFLSESTASYFLNFAKKMEKHPMALALILNEGSRKSLEDTFFWGLDAI